MSSFTVFRARGGRAAADEPLRVLPLCTLPSLTPPVPSPSSSVSPASKPAASPSSSSPRSSRICASAARTCGCELLCDISARTTAGLAP
ncbi:hypothetical protein TSOC_012468 [Tetrabaena socialis]|uniref:Uncharacterized protein n=1 Tax=Tetrabaena socialis TaxID=47790 RepID=A0A2J7ZMZ9_9CHLO|nr:hypothetical protein TSOC_012468 [Tetrabaena socialis]|eukprot:PNH01630.1 hypothetical protein TSOC_012468 [Tetrabaena socialis]